MTTINGANKEKRQHQLFARAIDYLFLPMQRTGTFASYLRR
jgi:hypothetical protein